MLLYFTCLSKQADNQICKQFLAFTNIISGCASDCYKMSFAGETPIDCAQTTLGHKMRQRLDSTIVT